MFFNKSITLSIEDTYNVLEYFNLGSGTGKKWLPTEIKKEIKYKDNIVYFIIKPETALNYLTVEINILNKKTSLVEKKHYGYTKTCKELFNIFKVKAFENDYIISVRPFHIKNDVLYNELLKSFYNTLNCGYETYIQNLRLNPNDVDDVHELWSIAYPILSELEYFSCKNYLLELISNKLSYYGYTETVSINEFNRIHKIMLIDNNNFKNTIAGLLLYLNKATITKNLINDLKLIINELSNIYYNYIYIK